MKEKDYSNLDDIYKLSVNKVEAKPDYSLLVTYNNDEQIEFQVEPILKNKLVVLKNYDLFKKVFVDEFGNIAWNIDENIDSDKNWDNRIDISKEVIYLDGIKL